MELTEILTRIHPLPAESLSRIAEKAERLEVPKGSVIIAADTVCHSVYFVARGVVRAYCIADGRDITFWIGEEGTVALSMQSYVHARPGYESIVTLEDCELYRISSPELHKLYATDIHLANWGRVFAEKEILRAEHSLIPQLFTTGRERYRRLLAEQPHLLNRIPLENLATYLGLTPVSYKSHYSSESFIKSLDNCRRTVKVRPSQFLIFITSRPDYDSISPKCVSEVLPRPPR